MTATDRRRFLQAAGSATLLAGAALATENDQNGRTPRVDTHLHCFAGPPELSAS